MGLDAALQALRARGQQTDQERAVQGDTGRPGLPGGAVDSVLGLTADDTTYVQMVVMLAQGQAYLAQAYAAGELPDEVKELLVRAMIVVNDVTEIYAPMEVEFERGEFEDSPLLPPELEPVEQPQQSVQGGQIPTGGKRPARRFRR